MGFKLRKFGKHLAGNMGRMAQGVSDKLECAVVAPPIPVMLGAAAVFAGVALVKRFKNRRDKGHHTSSPTSEVCAAYAPRIFAG